MVSNGPQRGYTASASSDFDSVARPVHFLFNGRTNSTSADVDAWMSEDATNYGTSGTDFAYSGSRNLGTGAVNGEWIKIELPYKLFMTSIKMFTRYNDSNARPEDFKVYGSNDNSNWTEVLSETNNPPPTEFGNSVGKIYTADTTSTAYKYFGLVVTKLTGHNTFFSLQELEYFGTQESTPVLARLGGAFEGKVANFRVYNKCIKEDQALELWDAQKDEFGRAKSSVTVYKGRVGIGTTEPQGRLAVVDEPDPTTYGLQEFPPKPLVGYKTHIEGHGVFKSSASTEISSNPPWKVFDKDLGSGIDNWLGDGWNSAYGTTTVYNTSGIYLGNKSLGGYMGEWIVIEMPYKTNLTKMQIYPRANILGRSPKDGVLLGSNDGVTWNVVHQFTGKTYTAYEYTDFIISYVGNYSYYGLVMTAGGADGNTDSAAIIELKFFGTREQVTKQSVLHDGQLTLTKNLNSSPNWAGSRRGRYTPSGPARRGIQYLDQPHL